MNISHFRSILFILKIFGEIVTNLKKLLLQTLIYGCQNIVAKLKR